MAMSFLESHWLSGDQHEHPALELKPGIWKVGGKHSYEPSFPHSAGAAGLSTSLEGSAESAASPRWSCPQGQVPIEPTKELYG